MKPSTRSSRREKAHDNHSPGRDGAPPASSSPSPLSRHICFADDLFPYRHFVFRGNNCKDIGPRLTDSVAFGHVRMSQQQFRCGTIRDNKFTAFKIAKRNQRILVFQRTLRRLKPARRWAFANYPVKKIPGPVADRSTTKSLKVLSFMILKRIFSSPNKKHHHPNHYNRQQPYDNALAHKFILTFSGRAERASTLCALRVFCGHSVPSLCILHS
jgi:hypothetical protein